MHLSVNLSTGLWQDFKSGDNGNFFHLISYLEGIPLDRARAFIMSKMFDTPEKLFQNISEIKKEQKSLYSNNIGDEFKNFKEVDLKNSKNSIHLSEKLASNFVRERKLHRCKFYVSLSGQYINRIIIPYTKNKKPYYFQARNLTSFGMKYLNPKASEYGIKSSDILYPFNKDKNYIIVTEGPLDSMSLQINGFNSTCTQGSNLSANQIKQLGDRKIILSYDNDEAGKKGIVKSRTNCLYKNMDNLYVLHPPEKYKDWNEFHVDSNESNISDYITANIKKIDFEYFLTSKLS